MVNLQDLPRLVLIRFHYRVECLSRSKTLSFWQEDEDVDCANRTLTLQAEHLPFEFFRWQVREHESNIARDIRSAGKRDWSITEPRNGDLSVREIESENPSVDRDTR